MVTGLPRELPHTRLDEAFLTDVGLHEWTVAKWRAIPDRGMAIAATFWRGGRECTWVTATRRGICPTDLLLHTYGTPEAAQRAYLDVYPEQAVPA